MELEEAINQCELYVQAEARISLVDTDPKGNICFSECDTSAIKRLLTYIKKESISRAVVEEAIIEWDKNIKWANADDHYYAIKILQEILTKGENKE